MLRHLRMTPPKESATAGRAPRWLMWMQPLYHYTAPHRRPRRGECDTICRCKFPLFTLCSPQLSPFDSGDDGLAATSAPSQSNNGGGGGANNNNNNNGVAATSSSDDATATSSSSSSSSLPLTQRRLWRRHAAACFAAPLGSTSGALPPHILPNKPACYRCEVCDGFQRGSRCIQHVEDEAPNNLHTIDAATRPSTTPTSATQGQTHGVAKCCSSGCDDDDACDDDDDDDDDAWDGHPTSTDIANSIMDDLELAELRYINPYAVEVAGRYPLSSWSRKLARQMQAQVRRSNLSVDLSHTRTSLHDTSATHMTLYQDWLQQQLHKKKMHATRRSQPERTTYLRDRLHLVERGAYLARFAVSAYGLPYELGYFGSVRGIMKLQAKPHRRYTCATSEEQMDSMRRMLVGSGSSSSSSSPLLEFAMSRYSLRVGQPSFALVLDHAQRRVVLTFRGTMTLADAIVDVMEGYVEVDLHHPETPLAVQVGSAKHLVPIHALSSAEAQRVRRWTNNSNNKSKTPSTSSSSSSSGEELRTRIPLGFYEAATEAATHVLPALHEIYQHYSDYELNITGHSLGGILATVFHLLYCIPNNNNNNMAAVGGFPRVCTVALAPAPCVEVKALAKIHALLAEDKRRRGSELVSFVYGSDIVARLQVRSIRSLLMPTPTPTPSPSIATSSSSAVVPTNAMPNTRAMPSDAQLPELALPGLVLNVPHALKRCCFEVEEQAAWRTQIVADVASITHHFPLHYLRSLNSLEAYYRKRLVELGNDDG